MKRSSVVRGLACLAALLLLAAKPAPQPPSPFAAEIVIALADPDSVDVSGVDVTLSRWGTIAPAAPGIANRNPTFSPDGSKILFHSNIQGPGLYLKDNTSDSGPIVKLVTTRTYHGLVSPTWSPDGRFIVYCDLSDSHFGTSEDYDLYVIELGVNLEVLAPARNLTQGSGHLETFPSFSPDGREIAAKVWVDPNRQQLFVYGFDDLSATLSPPRALTPYAQIGFMSGRASWTRDPSLPRGLAYACQVGPGDGGWDLCFSDATLTDAVPRVLHEQRNTHHSHPSFAPDGRLVMMYSPGKRFVSIVENAGDVINYGAAPIIRNIRNVGAREDIFTIDWR